MIAWTASTGMHYLIVVLLLVHGFIHLLGFLTPWKLLTLEPLSERGARVVRLLWLIVAIGLMGAGLVRFMGRESWWMIAAPAIALSQMLIVARWRDAWAGTIANALLAVAVIVASGTSRFHDVNTQQARTLLATASSEAPSLLRPDEIASLPLPVRRWLDASGAVGRPRARTVRLLQRGGLRTAPDQPYAPAVARQYFTVHEPGFIWMVEVTMLRVVPIVGRDAFVNGRGRMLIKAGGVVTVADGTGPAFDQGTALRFLGEIIWFPSAAVAPYIRWEPIDERRARATITVKDVVASAVFEFDDRGRFAGLTAQRYYNGASLETWVIPVTEWKTIRGIEMPVRGGAVWKLASGDFDYYQWEIIDVETNRRALWAEDEPN